MGKQGKQGTVLLYLSPCFYPGDFVNCWEQPNITPEVEIPAGVISHTSEETRDGHHIT